MSHDCNCNDCWYQRNYAKPAIDSQSRYLTSNDEKARKSREQLAATAMIESNIKLATTGRY